MRRRERSNEATTMVHGFVRPGLEAVAEEFERNLTDGRDHGAAFAAFVDGSLAIDLWGGLADTDHVKPWDGDTLAGIFSGTKGLVVSCLLLLLERGLLDLDTPVCAYWPDFAAQGKSGILVRHLVSHQAGLPGLTTPVTVSEATDDKRMAGLVAAQPALCAPGTRFYYHALTFGWLCGELVRRIDGRSIGRFFQDEVARTLGMDAWIGLPERHEKRVAVLKRGPGFGAQQRHRDATPDRDPVAWSIWSNPPRFTAYDLPANSRRWRAAEIPATNGIASARSMARLYGCLARGGKIDAVRLLAPETIELASTQIAGGVEPYLGELMTFGVGFELQTDAFPFGPASVAFGHRGAGGSNHGAWPELKAGFSYITNTLWESKGADPRSAALLTTLHDGLASQRRAVPAQTGA